MSESQLNTPIAASTGPSQRERTLSLRGAATHWIEEGPSKSPLLVWLHGYPDTPQVWEPQVSAFHDDYECLRPFGRGLLDTDEDLPSSRYGVDSQVLDLLGILNHKEISRKKRPVFLIGHDIGGVMALHLAPLLGPELAGVVIMNSLSLPQMVKRFRTPEQLLRSWYVFAFQIPGVAERLIRSRPELVLGPKKKIEGLKDIPISTEQLTRPLRTYRELMKKGTWQWNAKAPKLRCPLMVLWGKSDPFLVTPTWDEWQEVGRDVTFRILDGGHWLQWQNAGEVNSLMKKFFEETLR